MERGGECEFPPLAKSQLLATKNRKVHFFLKNVFPRRSIKLQGKATYMNIKAAQIVLEDSEVKRAQIG